jgi:hypothetical protein
MAIARPSIGESGRAFPIPGAKYISTSIPQTGPTSSISTVVLSCQHIDDLSLIALGLQICGHPSPPLSNSIKASGRTAYRFVGKQRHRVAVKRLENTIFTRHLQGGWEVEGGSSTRDGHTRKPAWHGPSRKTMEHLGAAVVRWNFDIGIWTKELFTPKTRKFRGSWAVPGLDEVKHFILLSRPLSCS